MKTRGFSIVEVLMVLGVVVLIGGVGFVAWKAFTKSDVATQSSSPAVQSAQVITTKADLEAAEKALEELDFYDAEAEQAETQASL